MKKISGLLALVCLSGIISAQNNLVKNPGFEENTVKPKKVGELHRALGWASPTEGTADYYQKDAKSEEVGSPYNKLGFQDPRTGDGYAGAIFYSKRTDEREYLMGELLTPLEEEEKYCVEFYVSAADLSKYGMSEIGVYFSETKLRYDNWDPMPVRPYFINSSDRKLEKMDSWQLVCAEITAKGNEKYIVIGNFSQKDEMTPSRLRKPRGVAGVPIEYGYYYIDDVSVVHIDEMDGDCACADKIQRDDTGMNIVYTKVVGQGDKSKMTPAEIIDSKKIYFIELRDVLLPNSQGDLDEVAQLLTDNKNLKIEIMGYADPKELSSDSLIMNKRAVAIKNWLVDTKGIKADRISVVKGNPIVMQNESDALRIRRVDFSVME